MENSKPSTKIEVFIIGAGIGGLMMALLLEQIDIQYHIFERASEVKPLGSAMALTGHNLTVLDQLGIYKELLQVSRNYKAINFYRGDCKHIGGIDLEKDGEKYGYDNLVFSRPDFYEILRKRVPVAKISYKKKVLKTEEKEGKVIIHCSDNTSYSGDILIGADGAYSGVRQSMYKQLNSKGLLPKEDLEDFSIGYTVTVGVAKADPKKYPVLEESRSQFCQVIYSGNSNCYVITLPNNQISWGLGTQLSRQEVKDMQFRSSEWSVDSSESTIKPFRDFPCPVGGTMGDIFDATPKELISKVYLEEKIFKTWHHGRIVLLGDGAANALHDAVVLANCLYAMKDNTEKSIHAAFRDYYDQRFTYAEMGYKLSSDMSNILNGQKFWEKLLRKVVISYVPTWVFDLSVKRAGTYIPQVAWLPLMENRGKEKPQPQKFKPITREKAVSL
ncbi:hypothetical protein BGZ76_001045 [Entomortierella beljakovae]|nr:hypothetical protein BGZ76_001045 [Entomortierella beljakovae]